uniref:Uncharacterized protein n=1 Tax=Pyxicephalus adspersus TaxID=30357 RepID=A0AAV3A7D1_PYXAD|nr:TPA: hypothetical protein GDO54_014411 [Pyxicephalus adspersus]
MGVEDTTSLLVEVTDALGTEVRIKKAKCQWLVGVRIMHPLCKYSLVHVEKLVVGGVLLQDPGKGRQWSSMLDTSEIHKDKYSSLFSHC